VTFFDRRGEIVLMEIMTQEAECVAIDVYTKHLLENLRSKFKRSRVKKKAWQWR
jgi:hypothetical protein